MTESPVTPEIDPVDEWSEFETSLAVHETDVKSHTRVLKVPVERQVVIPPPAYALSQVTAKVDPVVPVIDPKVVLSEFAT